MVKDSLSSDDANSTQLTGKKLKDRGVVVAETDGKLTDADDDSLETEVDTEREREFFIESDYWDEKETEEEREEKKRRELEAKKAAEKNQQRKADVKERNEGNPNLQLDKIEQGIENSQNEGKPVHEAKAVQEQELSQAQRDNLKNSVEPGKVADARSGADLQKGK